MKIADDLDEAVAIWFWEYVYREERIIERFGQEYGEELLGDVRIINDKFWEYKPDWTKETLEEAANAAINRIRKEYPDLKRKTLAWMENNFLFSYR